jgi:translation initiation factor 1A
MFKYINYNKGVDLLLEENNEPQNVRVKVPNKRELEMFGVVTQLMGVNNISIMCEDGKQRICRIPGKMFKHIWIKQGDLVIVKLWDFQPTKGDVVWRYLGFQVSALEKRGLLTEMNKHAQSSTGNRNSF